MARGVNSIQAERLTVLLGAWSAGEGRRWSGLAERLAALITSGSLQHGVRLPTERALAASLGCSRTTVATAYDHLVERGLLSSRQGSGTQVVGPPGVPAGNRGRSPIFETLGRGPTGFVDLALAEPPTAAATRRIVAGLDPRWVTSHIDGTGYLPQGLPALRDGLAGWLTASGLPVSSAKTVITIGAQQAIALAVEVLCPPGSTILVEAVTYPGVLDVARRRGLQVVPIPADAHGPDPEALDDLITRLRPALLYAVPVGSNPMATSWTRARLDAVAAVL